MSKDVLNDWLASGKPALIRGIRLRPQEHPAMPGSPLVVERGQAQAVFLQADDQSLWILKSFLPGRKPDSTYLLATISRLPQHPGLVCGNCRHLLTPSDLNSEPGSFHRYALASWIDQCILMPRIMATDWAGVADQIRSGSLQLSRRQRMQLVRSIAALVTELEKGNLAHHDLSSSNVFMKVGTGEVFLIDFESLFVPGIPMPNETTCGTEGYIAPFAWRGSVVDPAATWCPLADRFGLALLAAEFLLMDQDVPLQADGGMFAQADLKARDGVSVQLARDRLRREFPEAARLFDYALAASDFRKCPGPENWESFGNSACPVPTLPSTAGCRDSLRQAFEELNHSLGTLRHLMNSLRPIGRNASAVVSPPPDPWSSSGHAPLLSDVKKPW